MLSQNQNTYQSAKHLMEVPMVFNTCSKMSGELVLTTDARIDGKVFGKIESDRNVIIGISGHVKGFLRANNLVVFGRIEGNFIVSGTTTFHPGSSIFGSLYTKVLDIKVGAIITAHINTYKELKAFDEAQLALAEEMLRIQTNRMTVPSYPEHDFLDNDMEFEGETVVLIKEETEEIISEKPIILTGEVSLKSKEQPEELFTSPKRELHKSPFSEPFRDEPGSVLANYTNMEENEMMSEPCRQMENKIPQEASLLKDASGKPANGSDSTDTGTKQYTDESIPEQEGYIFLTTHTIQPNSKIPPQQPIAETEHLSPDEATKVEEQVSVAETTLQSESIPIPEPILTPEQVNKSEPILIIDAAPKLPRNNSAKANLNPVKESALATSLMEQSVKEEITFYGSELTNPENTISTSTPLPGSKSNTHSKFNFSDLSSLFSRPKSVPGSPPEKLNENKNSKSENNVNDPEEISITNGSEKKSSFLANSIKEIPPSDHSSFYK